MAEYDKLIGPDGQPQYGRFPAPIGEINYRDFNYTTPMDHKAGILARHFHYKQFQFVGITGKRYIIGCAIVSLKYVSNAFVYLFDRDSKTAMQKSLLQPLSLNCSMSAQPDAGIHRFQKGNATFTFTAHAKPRQRHINITVGTELNLALTLTEPPEFQPLALCTRTGFSGWTYTQKACALDVTGHLHWKDLDLDINSRDFLGGYDWSCGYMRRQTAWNWASLSGILADGTRIGANLANGVNETGFNENGIWLGGTLHPLGPVNFHFSRHDRDRPWNVTSSDGRLELTFVPEGERREKLDFMLLASNFTQLTGSFQGHFTTADGERIELTGIPGFCEDHYAKW